MINYKKIHIGRRTFKTVLAVLISLVIVSFYGATTSKMMFAMIGAMNAVEVTFKKSLESCMTQIVGMICGAFAGIVLRATPLHPLLCVGIGIVFIIILYNVLNVNISPVLPCMMVVSICTTADVMPFTNAMGRLWDTAIGLAVGMIINVLVLPFDNSLKIRETIECLEKEVMLFLEDMFDGDEDFPNTDKMRNMIDDMGCQLGIYSKQWMPVVVKRDKEKLAVFLECENQSRELLAQMEVLGRMKKLGRLDAEVRARLIASGAKVRKESEIARYDEADIITNYHVTQILDLRKELIDTISSI